MSKGQGQLLDATYYRRYPLAVPRFVRFVQKLESTGRSHYVHDIVYDFFHVIWRTCDNAVFEEKLLRLEGLDMSQNNFQFSSQFFETLRDCGDE